MEFLNEIFSNQPLIATFIAWLVAQCLKIVIRVIKEHKIDFRWFVSTGGLPSSHSAAVVALATSLGLNLGFNSELFAISVVIAGITIFDARVIRQASGKQAEVLNKIFKDLYKQKGLRGERLKELLGHTSFEVFFGVVLGISVGILLFYIGGEGSVSSSAFALLAI
jgi:hypothetical protein